MEKIKNYFNSCLSNKGLIREQIKKQEEYIKENIEKINSLMQDERCLLHLKVNGNYFALDSCHRAILYHRTNIEKLKNGDFELCKELIEHEKEIEKQKQIKEQREASLTPEELKLYREGKLFISWKDED